MEGGVGGAAGGSVRIPLSCRERDGVDRQTGKAYDLTSVREFNDKEN